MNWEMALSVIVLQGLTDWVKGLLKKQRNTNEYMARLHIVRAVY